MKILVTILFFVIISCCIIATSFSSSVAVADSQRVDVFTIGEGGYYCIKIPYLFSTMKGTLLALAEARYNSCSDFTATDLVIKRSYDNGKTWTPLQIFYSNTSLTNNISNVVGNAAPVQIRSTGRIVIPFCINNLNGWQMHSDDDGTTFQGPFPIINSNRGDWQWLGFGPPGALQMMNGRLVIPAYHSYEAHWQDGTITRAHLMLNDDPNGAPDAWRIGAVAPGIEWTNENQVVELNAGHLLIGARGELIERIQIESFDGGETLQHPYFNGVPMPLGGCEFSTVFHRKFDTLFMTGPSNIDPRRFNMSLWSAQIEEYFPNGSTKIAPWKSVKVIDANRSAYSSLVVMSDNTSLGLLYERSNVTDFIFLPTSIVFQTVWP